MSHLVLGFITGASLILALGPQNIFVIEQGLKKEFTFLVCLICSISDLFLIFLGIFIFYYFQNFFTPLIELLLNLSLLIFLFFFVWGKIKDEIKKLSLNTKKNKTSTLSIIFKTLGFTYLNPHVYSDTVFFLGNFSKNFLLKEKIFFGIGASISSILFFFSIGYCSRYFSNYINTIKIWKIVNLLIIIFMLILATYIFLNIINFF